MPNGLASPAWRNAGDLANLTMVLELSYRTRKFRAVKQKLLKPARLTGAKLKFRPMKRKRDHFQHSSVNGICPIVGLERYATLPFRALWMMAKELREASVRSGYMGLAQENAVSVCRGFTEMDVRP